MKIFGAGYPRTGTKSLAVALRTLGLSTVHSDTTAPLFPDIDFPWEHRRDHKETDCAV